MFWYYHSSFAIDGDKNSVYISNSFTTSGFIKSSLKLLAVLFVLTSTVRVCSRAAPNTTSLLDFIYILGASYMTYKGGNATFKYFKMWKSQVKIVTPYGEPCSSQSFTLLCFPNKNQDTLLQGVNVPKRCVEFRCFSCIFNGYGWNHYNVYLYNYFVIKSH